MNRKRLLLHVCCGPCAIVPCLEFLEEGYEITAWYMNPNIQPLSEYLRRREAVAQCAERLGILVVYEDEAWDLTAWLTAQLPRAMEKSRCEWCCGSRLESAFFKAKKEGFDYFTTSLLYSRYQPHDFIAQKGFALGQLSGPDFLYRDFRTGWQKGIDISREWGLYRQPYCGCVFSEAERYAKNLARLR